MSTGNNAKAFVKEKLSEETQILICYIQEEFINMKNEMKEEFTTLIWR